MQADFFPLSMFCVILYGIFEFFRRRPGQSKAPPSQGVHTAQPQLLFPFHVFLKASIYIHPSMNWSLLLPTAKRKVTELEKSFQKKDINAIELMSIHRKKRLMKMKIILILLFYSLP
jgi:hypothetical protein